jgi:hypothetical protein
MRSLRRHDSSTRCRVAALHGVAIHEGGGLRPCLGAARCRMPLHTECVGLSRARCCLPRVRRAASRSLQPSGLLAHLHAHRHAKVDTL